MTAFALYRLPHDHQVTLVQQLEGDLLQLTSLSALNGRQGFVVAPFAIGDEQPLLLIRADRVTQCPLEQLPSLACYYNRNAGKAGDRSTYAVDFANFHAHLLSGEFHKLVLARSVCDARPAEADPLLLFRCACQHYPRLFICLVSTPQSGTWLMATPEVLLSGAGTQWHTMALAGTMKLEGEQLAFDTALPQDSLHIAWTDKNIQEQRYVATYITECLEQFTSDFSERGPYTVRAGNLVHLRSDFRFTLPDADHLGDVLQVLHPTPAVCGLPKHHSFDFILANEHAPRRYYSGFMGPLNLSPSEPPCCPPRGTLIPKAQPKPPLGEVWRGLLPSTHLFVSLRCMELLDDACILYVGGGLLPDSVEEQEWQETEAKMETMRQLLVHSS